MSSFKIVIFILKTGLIVVGWFGENSAIEKSIIKKNGE